MLLTRRSVKTQLRYYVTGMAHRNGPGWSRVSYGREPFVQFTLNQNSLAGRRQNGVTGIRLKGRHMATRKRTRSSNEPSGTPKIQNDQLLPYKESLAKKGYEWVSYLGTGNWAEVYKVRHCELDCMRALKILFPHHAREVASL